MLLSANSDRAIYKIFLSEFNELIRRIKANSTLVDQKGKKPVAFIYVLWKSDWNMVYLINRIKKWWTKIKN